MPGEEDRFAELKRRNRMQLAYVARKMALLADAGARCFNCRYYGRGICIEDRERRAKPTKAHDLCLRHRRKSK